MRLKKALTTKQEAPRRVLYSKSRGRSVDTTKGAATLTRTRGRKVVKAVDRDKAMKLKKKLSKFAKGGKFPDLTGDGKVTRADILKGRGVFRSGGTGSYWEVQNLRRQRDL